MLVLSLDADAQAVASLSQRESMTSGWAWLVSYEVVSYEVPALVGWVSFTPFFASKGRQAFAKQVSDYAKSDFNLTVSPDSVDLTYSAALHDAIMLYAHAVTKVLSEGDSLHDGQAVTKALRGTTFEGVGEIMVALDKHGDRIESYKVMNYVLEGAARISSVPVGMYDAVKRQYRAYERTIMWPGNTAKVPADFFSGVRFFAACIMIW